MKIDETKAVAELRKVSMTSEQRAVLWSKLDIYVQKHEPVKQLSYFAALLQNLKSFFASVEK